MSAPWVECFSAEMTIPKSLPGGKDFVNVQLHTKAGIGACLSITEMASTSTTRATLLARVVAYFVEHGVANFTLRSLAAEIGTSHQLLMYHFASREALTREALGQLHAQVLIDLDQYLESEPTARQGFGAT